jgi:hypothetical protein
MQRITVWNEENGKVQFPVGICSARLALSAVNVPHQSGNRGNP